MSNGGITRNRIYAQQNPGEDKGKSDGPRFASRPGRAQSLRIWRARRAAGDFVNAASDPRGFVKAELNRPNGGLLEAPGLSSTPALASAVFAYQLEVQQARAAAAKSGAPASEAAPPSPDAKPQQRNPSLNSSAMDMSG